MRDTSYGELEPYCENYKTPYAMMICALAGAGLIMIGEIPFLNTFFKKTIQDLHNLQCR